MKLSNEYGYHGHCKTHMTFRLHSKIAAKRFCRFCNKETIILSCNCKVRECKDAKRRRAEETKNRRRRT